MKKAYTVVLFPLIPNLFHNICLAHSYNLIGETWIDYENFKLLDTVVKNIKASFVYSVARKRRWREHLALNSISLDNFSFDLEGNAQDISITLPPLPVKTRWNSWLMLDLEFFKIRNSAIAPFVASRIDQTGAFLRNGTNNPPFSIEMSQLLSHNNYQTNDFFIPIFSEAFKLALAKFEKHTNNHSALPLFRAIQCFNPQFIQSSTNHHNLNNYNLITEFQNPSNEIISEWAIYCGLSEVFEEGSLDLNQYWQGKKGNFPNLSKIAFIYIWLPISGVEL
ncbi:hypothetical protein RclHR1_01680003 [Rhizophagus clarus]|nr:hypothetical protein RclHR1_01680003 [Rhizophagus clarus]